MVEHGQTSQDTSQSNNNDPNRPKLGEFGGVLVGGAWAFIGLLLVSIFWPNLTERTKFFTGNLWNLVIAFAVLAQVKINQKQWKAMIDSLKRTDKMIVNMQGQLKVMRQEASAATSAADTAKRALRIAERPYLHVTNITVRPIPFQPHTPIFYSVRVKNTGHTPAYETTGAIYIRITKEPMTDDPVYKALRTGSKGTLGSGLAHVWLRTTPPDIDLQPADITEIESGEKLLYVFGFETHRDGFSNSIYRLRWCFQYDPVSKRMAAASCHNDSTEYQPEKDDDPN